MSVLLGVVLVTPTVVCMLLSLTLPPFHPLFNLPSFQVPQAGEQVVMLLFQNEAITRHYTNQ